MIDFKFMNYHDVEADDGPIFGEFSDHIRYQRKQ